MSGRLALRTEDELVSLYGDALSALQDVRNVYIGEDPDPWLWIDKKELRRARTDFEAAYNSLVARSREMVGGVQIGADPVRTRGTDDRAGRQASG